MELSPASYVVLGMLRLGARSGYDIKQVVEISTRFFWNISHAQIYPSLERLEEAGLVSGRPDPAGRRPRRVYEITPEGERALAQWVGRTDEIPFELRDMGWLKLFFADGGDEGTAVELVRAIRRRSESELERMRRDVEPAAGALARDGGHRCPEVVLQIGMALHQATIDWCREQERRLALDLSD